MAVHVLACQLWLQVYTSVHQENCMTDPSVHKDIAQRISPALLYYSIDTCWKITKFWQLANTFCILRQLIECSLLPNLEKRTGRVTSCECMSCRQALQELLGQCSEQLYGQEHTTHAWWVSLSVLNAWKPHIAIAFKSCRLGTCISSGLFPWITLPVSDPITLNSYRLATSVLSYYPELL